MRLMRGPFTGERRSYREKRAAAAAPGDRPARPGPPPMPTNQQAPIAHRHAIPPRPFACHSARRRRACERACARVTYLALDLLAALRSRVVQVALLARVLALQVVARLALPVRLQWRQKSVVSQLHYAAHRRAEPANSPGNRPTTGRQQGRGRRVNRPFSDNRQVCTHTHVG